MGDDRLEVRSARERALPGSAAAQIVQICHKGPDRAGTPEEKR